MNRMKCKDTGEIFNNRKEAKDKLGRMRYNRYLRERKFIFLDDIAKIDLAVKNPIKKIDLAETDKTVAEKI